MQFNDTTNKTGIIQMIEKTTNLGDATISGTAAELAYFTNLINLWYQITGQYIWSVNKNWRYDDSNYSDFPMATTTLVDDQRDYVLPTSLRRILQVEILDSNGKYYNLTFKNPNTLVNEKQQETANKPSSYYLNGRSILLYPKPDTSQLTATEGLRITFERKLDLFTTADTSQEPGFDEEYHSILYYGPSMEWAATNNNTNIYRHCERMIGQFNGLLQLAQNHYKDRNANDRIRLARATFTNMK